ncbi:efflux RND transporter permease subunit [Gudongella sp. DL1XJH-153]|uniref:efflux RND transporter permease subunit n=1 Tax=Gudongella sp. DL1XJH-153 TaxID=3409804 RepID=UPI003BB67663
MNLSKLSVKRPVTITMIVLIVVLIGAISLTELPIDLFPEFEVPVAVVVTTYSGTGPQEMENLITRQIEGAIATVVNIDNVSSISSEGTSIIIAQFNFGVDMDMAALEMREKVDMVKGFLPEDAEDPMVMKIDPNAMPIVQISLSTEGDLAGLQDLAEDTFSQRLERIDGVASVDIFGGYSREIEIAVNQNELSNYGLSTGQLTQLLAASNMNLPGGSVSKGDQELSVRVTGEFEGIDDIRNMPVPLSSGDVIRLGDISEVNLVTQDLGTISRTDGNDSITMSLQKQSGRNTVQVSELISEEIEKLQRDYPNVQIDVVLDTADFIVQSINTVAKNALFGSLLAVFILYIFLKNLRTTLIIGIAIPISLITSFILLYFNGITLNIMTLGGLALAVGMLVDSAIVVLENIFRYNSEGHSREESAIEGASEVGMAITASTLTTIAVFVPIIFVEGIVGTIFRDFALTVTLSLAASLLVSLTIIPMLSSKILKVADTEKGKKRKLEKLYKAFDDIYGRVEKTYTKLLTKSLARRKITMFIALAVFIGSIASLLVVGMEFLPSTDEGIINISVDLPLGSGIEKIDQVTRQVEERIVEIPELQIISTSVGGGNLMMGPGGGGSATISLLLVPLSERDRSTSEVSEEIRQLAKDIPGAEISVSATSTTAMIGSGNPVSITIKGSELDVLEDISEDLKSIVESVEGTREVTTSISDSVPELQVLVDKEMAATYGLTTAQVANSVRNNASGSTVTRLKDGGEEIDVVIRSVGDITESIGNFEQMEISTPMGSNIPLSQIADVSIERGPTSINRENQERVVTINSQIVDRDLNSIVSDVEGELAQYQMPEGYSYSIGGENEEMIDAFQQLGLALVLALILIYMVMAAQFESLIYPFIIMFTIPLAFSGGALGLFLTGRSLGVTALIGVIILSGIVVNNGIVLIDYINTLRKRGIERQEAIKTAGPIRLRPILMTSLTTILGLIPIALGVGEGAELMAPLGSVVIGGLILSTVLTLVVVPVMYTILDDMSTKVKNKVKRNEESESEAL